MHSLITRSPPARCAITPVVVRLMGTAFRPISSPMSYVRRAFSYAFDYEQFLSDAYGSEVVQRRGPIPAGFMGYSDSSTNYSHNPTQAAVEMAQAWGGEVAAHGFSLSLAYPSGNTVRQLFANRVKTDIEALDASFHIYLVELSGTNYTTDRNAHRLPIFVNGWQADIAHPYNWVVPYMTGMYAILQGMPESMRNTYQGMTSTCLGLTGACRGDLL